MRVNQRTMRPLWCLMYLTQRLNDHVEAGKEHDGIVHNAEIFHTHGLPLAHEALASIHPNDVCARGFQLSGGC